MRGRRLPQPAIDSFSLHFDRVIRGERGTLREEDIYPVADIPDAGTLEAFRPAGQKALDRVCVIKLNGGLGTSMGLEGAKSLLPVREEHTFLDLTIQQVLALRALTGASIPLLLMNSFRTATDSELALAAYTELRHTDLPLSFLQHQVPKILADSMAPAESVDFPEHAWCPPGHGDLFTALGTSGVLERLIGSGIEYAFISNADNLGAMLDHVLLGHMEEDAIDFLMEVADRTPADRKGGHLCRLRDGRLALRESAQCPPDAETAFQDVEKYRYFNTNSLWIRLPALRRLLDEHGGFLPLPTIINRKSLDPRDPASPPVLQLETAMGAAISLFERASAVRVPRQRFSPVKNTNDLLAVRSDCYDLTDDARIVLHPSRSAPPVIDLDERYFKMLDAFESRFPEGPPSLLRCASLRVEGDVTFGNEVVIEGEAVIRATSSSAVIHANTVIRGKAVF